VSIIIPLSVHTGKSNQPDDPAGGLSLAERDADLLERWAHLARPGPQPCNQVGTLGQQLRKVFGPAGAPLWTGCSDLCPPGDAEPAAPDPADMAGRLAATIRAHPEAMRAALLELLAEDVAMIAVEVARGLQARRSESGECGECVRAAGRSDNHAG
jgi:hypothetical protein